MKKFEIEYYYLVTQKEIVEADHKLQALKEFREDDKYVGIRSVKYVYSGNEPLKEWYCRWWNGHSWQSKVVLAHDRDEIDYNIRDTLDFAVYDFACCPNNAEAISRLTMSLID